MHLRATVLALGCLALAGCSDRAASSTTSTHQQSKLAQAQASHEYPSARPAAQRASSAALTPVAAIRSFATAYINWNAETVAIRMRALALDSIGQARAAMQLAAADTAQDYELQRGGIANSGTVEAVAPLFKSRDRYVVVTLERTTSSNTTAYQGLRPAWHVTLATVMQLSPGQWVLSGWQPQN